MRDSTYRVPSTDRAPGFYDRAPFIGDTGPNLIVITITESLL